MTHDPRRPRDDDAAAKPLASVTGMMSLDDELAAALAEAEAAVSAPRPRRASDRLRSDGQPGRGGGGARRMAAPAVSPPSEGVDLDVLGALDAAISGAYAAPVEPTRAAGPAAPAAPIAADLAADLASSPAAADSMFEDSMFDAPRATRVSAGGRESGLAAAEEPTRPTPEALATAPTVGHDAAERADPQPAAAAETTAATADGGGEARSEADRRAEHGAAVLDALAGWMRLVRTCAAPRADAGMTLAAARHALGSMQAVGGAWSAELRGHAWFVDDMWLPVPAHHGAALGEFVAALRRAQRSGVWVSGDATAEQLLKATQAFVQAVRGKGSEGLNGLDGLGFLERPSLQPNAESWVASVVRRCVAMADLMAGVAGFPEAIAIDLLDELCQTIPAQLGAVLRAQELRGTTWTTPWAAISTTTLTLATLRSIGTSPRVTRSAALAMWALTLSARRGELPPDLPTLAARAAARLPAMTSTAGWSPVGAGARGLLRRLANPADEAEGVPALARLLYRVHAARIGGAPHLLAAIASLGADGSSTEWVSALLNAVGPIPIGTPVRLADGRRGLVVDLVGEARPLVQVGATMLRPSQDVALLAPDSSP